MSTPEQHSQIFNVLKFITDMVTHKYGDYNFRVLDGNVLDDPVSRVQSMVSHVIIFHIKHAKDVKAFEHAVWYN